MITVTLDPSTRRHIIAIDKTLRPSVPLLVKILTHGGLSSGGIMLWYTLKLVRKQLRRPRHQVVLPSGTSLRCTDNFAVLHRKNLIYILIPLPILSREVWLQVHSCMLSN